MKIIEAFDNLTKQLAYWTEGYVDSDEFREQVFQEFCVKPMVINHRYVNGLCYKTVGYSRRVY